MASLKIALQTDPANASTGFPGNTIGDIYLDPVTSQCRLTASLSEEVAQLLFTRFRFFLGEWFLDASVGVPWLQQILGVKNSILVVQSILRSVVVSCPGVLSLLSFAAPVTGRNIGVTFVAQLADGTTLSSANIPPFDLKF